MGKHPNFDNFDELFKMKKFELTEAQYEKITGARLPKNSDYLLKKSAIAKQCKKHGFKLILIEKRIICTKEGA